MSTDLSSIVSALDLELRVDEMPDYPGALNGLQMENNGSVTRVAVAVDASRDAIDEAVRIGADLLVVHHGLFWAGAQQVTGNAFAKYRSLILNNVAVYASHLPLDLHPQLGNNALLAKAFGLVPSAGFARFKTVDIGVMGTSDELTSTLVSRVGEFVNQFGGSVRTSVPVADRRTRRWAICSGGGASSETIREAHEKRIDTLIVGEGPHHTTVEAMELDICVVYAGHYATETLGVQKIGEFILNRFGIPWTFMNLPTGS